MSLNSFHSPSSPFKRKGGAKIGKKKKNPNGERPGDKKVDQEFKKNKQYEKDTCYKEIRGRRASFSLRVELLRRSL